MFNMRFRKNKNKENKNETKVVDFFDDFDEIHRVVEENIMNAFSEVDRLTEENKKLKEENDKLNEIISSLKYKLKSHGLL